MTFPKPFLVSSTKVNEPVGQKYTSKVLVPLGGRGRSRDAVRRAHGGVDGYWLKLNMAGLWGRYVRMAYLNRDDLRAEFGVSFQTACNWWDGTHAPSAAAYAKASLEDGGRLNRIMVGAK